MRRPSGLDVADLDVGDAGDRLGARGRPTEPAVLPVEPGGPLAGEGDEPLAARAVRMIRPGHRDHAQIVRQRRAFHREIPARPAVAGAAGIAALDHEATAGPVVVHHPMHERVVVETVLGEVSEVPRGVRGDLGGEVDPDLAEVGLHHHVAVGMDSESGEDRWLAGVPVGRGPHLVEGRAVRLVVGVEQGLAESDDPGVAGLAVGPDVPHRPHRLPTDQRLHDQRGADRLAVGHDLHAGGPHEVGNRGQGGGQVELAGQQPFGRVDDRAVRRDEQQGESVGGRCGPTPQREHHGDGTVDPVVEPLRGQKILVRGDRRVGRDAERGDEHHEDAEPQATMPSGCLMHVRCLHGAGLSIQPGVWRVSAGAVGR